MSSILGNIYLEKWKTKKKEASRTHRKRGLRVCENRRPWCAIVVMWWCWTREREYILTYLLYMRHIKCLYFRAQFNIFVCCVCICRMRSGAKCPLRCVYFSLSLSFDSLLCIICYWCHCYYYCFSMDKCEQVWFHTKRERQVFACVLNLNRNKQQPMVSRSWFSMRMWMCVCASCVSCGRHMPKGNVNTNFDARDWTCGIDAAAQDSMIPMDQITFRFLFK